MAGRQIAFRTPPLASPVALAASCRFRPRAADPSAYSMVGSFTVAGNGSPPLRVPGNP